MLAATKIIEDLRRENADLKAKLAASEAALHRFQHGQQIEGDYICEAAEKERAARLKAEAACAAKDVVISVERDRLKRDETCLSMTGHMKLQDYDDALSLDAGRGWHSPQEWEAVQAKLAAKDQALLRAKAAFSNVHYWEGVPAAYAQAIEKEVNDALSTDAGQPILDYIAAARRLRDKLNTSKMLVDHAGEVALAIADVDAADAKLGGKP